MFAFSRLREKVPEGRMRVSSEHRKVPSYSFVHLPLAREDFTQASMKAMPATPSAMPGKATSLSAFLPLRAALMRLGRAVSAG